MSPVSCVLFPFSSCKVMTTSMPSSRCCSVSSVSMVPVVPGVGLRGCSPLSVNTQYPMQCLVSMGFARECNFFGKFFSRWKRESGALGGSAGIGYGFHLWDCMSQSTACQSTACQSTGAGGLLDAGAGGRQRRLYLYIRAHRPLRPQNFQPLPLFLITIITTPAQHTRHPRPHRPLHSLGTLRALGPRSTPSTPTPPPKISPPSPNFSLDTRTPIPYTSPMHGFLAV